MQDGVPHLVVVPDVEGAEHVQRFCILAKGSAVVPDLLLLVAHRAHTRTEFYYRVVQHYLHQSHRGCQDVEGQEDLLVQLREVPLQEIQKVEGVRQSVRIYVRVFHYHPAGDQGEEHQHEGEDQQGHGGEILAEAVDLGGVTLQEGSVGDVPGEDVEEGEGDDHGDACVKEAGHNQDKVEVRGLLVDIQFEIGDLFVHGFLKDFSLVILEFVFADAAAPVEDVDQPYDYSVEDEIVGEEGWYVSVPDGCEGGVETEFGHLQEICDIGWDYGQEGNVTAGLEPEYIGIDEYGDEDGVEDQEYCVYCCFGVEPAGLGEGPHAVDQFVHNEPKNKVSDGFGDEDDVLDGLLNIDIFEVAGAGSADGLISEGGDQIGIAVAPDQSLVVGCGHSNRIEGVGVDPIAVVGVRGDVDSTYAYNCATEAEEEENDEDGED